MSEAVTTRQSLRSGRRPRLVRRWWFWVVIALTAVLAAAATWVGVRGLAAKTELESAQALTSQLKTQALALDIAGANMTLDRISAHAEEAVALTGDPFWRAGELFPMLGQNLTAVRELAAITSVVMKDVARPLLGVAGSVDPASFAPKDGAIDIQPLVAAAPTVAQANAAIKEALVDVGNIETGMSVSQVVVAKQKVLTLLEGLAPTLETLDVVVPVLGPLLGSEGPRNYVLMFMNSAEVRALGGTGLSFTSVTVDNGRIDIGDALPAGHGNFRYYVPGEATPIPDGADALYQPGAYGGFIADATMRPNFVTGSEMVQAMWEGNVGTNVDGVIGMDLTALSYAMRGMEPAEITTRDVLTSDNVVALLMNGVYQRYWSGNDRADNLQQDLVFAEAVTAISDRLTGGQFEPTALMEGLAQAAEERRLLMWSAHETEQAAFELLGVDGAMPVSDAATDRVGIYFHENVGSKMSYYLHSAVQLDKATCRPDGRQSYRVGITLTNAIPADAARSISPSILGTFKRSGLAPGVQRTMVYVLAPPGGEILRATVDGVEVPIEGLHDEAYPGVRLVPVTHPQASSTLVVDVVSPSVGEKAIEAEVTPMIKPTTVTVGALDCATVPAE
jgi:hypothetical protein